MPKNHPQLKRIKIKGEKVYIDDKLQNNIDGETCKIIFPVDTSDKADFEAVYLKDKNAVYFVGLKIYRSQAEPKVHIRKVTTDILKFEIIGDGMLSKDQTHVYLWGKPLEGVDAPTFELIPSYYFARDKNHVYYYADYEPNFMPLLYADPKTFIPFKDKYGDYNGFGSDKDNLYSEWSLSNNQKWDLSNMSPIFKEGKMFVKEFNDSEERVADFIRANKNMTGYWWSDDYAKKPQDCNPLGKFHYAKNSVAVYTKKMNYDTPELINGADPKTFEPITEQYSRDKDHVYYYGYQIPGIKPKTVRILTTDILPLYSAFKYISDTKRVFCITEKYDEFYSFEMVGADPDTFKIIDDIWTQDKDHVYKKGVVHKSGTTDKPTVIKLNDRFSKDDEYVYWDGRAIKKSDPKTFELLFDDGHQSWAKDSINLYNANGHRIVKGVDGKTFSMLDHIYGRDKKIVFSFESERSLPSADVKTFEIIPETGLGKDKSNFFFMGKKITSKKYTDLSEKLMPLLKDLKALKKKREELWIDL